VTILNFIHIFDLVLFFGAISYGYLRNDELNYKVFKDDKFSLLYFRIMLALVLLLYCSLAAEGEMHGPWFVIYCFYIAALLVWEERVYFNKRQYLVSLVDILTIEVIREIILIAGGFWRIN